MLQSPATLFVFTGYSFWAYCVHIKSALQIATMPPAADKFSTLPDTIICFILSKLPIKEAIRSSILSKSWRYLYTQMPQLTLSPHLLLGPVNADPDPVSIATVENIISKIMLLHSFDLEAFYVSIEVRSHTRLGYDSQWRFTRDNIHKWVGCVQSRNVQRLTLCDSPERETPPPPLFSCTRLVTLTLYNYILSDLPTHLPGFNHLINCSFDNVELTDQSLARFISHCPFLQNLTLHNCDGLRQPVISAPNITDLDVGYGMEVEVLTVNCPKLNTLNTLDANLIKDLRVNEILFCELSYSIWQLKMQCGSSLIGLFLDSSRGQNYSFSAERFLDIVGSFQSLKELVVYICPLLEREDEMNVSLFSLLERLPGLERLELKGLSLWELARGPIPSALDSPLTNLRTISVQINGFDERELLVLGCLLQSTPVLEMMEFYLLEEDEYEDPEYTYTEFLEKMLCLRRISSNAKFLEKMLCLRRISSNATICRCNWFETLERLRLRLQSYLSD